MFNFLPRNSWKRLTKYELVERFEQREILTLYNCTSAELGYRASLQNILPLNHLYRVLQNAWTQLRKQIQRAEIVKKKIYTNI